MLIFRPISARPRRGVSLIEIIVAMTLLAFVIGSLSVLSAKSARRGPGLDVSAARNFVVIQQANRFSVLPYDSIKAYAPRIDTVIAGRFKYIRRVTYVQAALSEYKTVTVLLLPVSDTTRRDSLVFVRAKTYAKSPLFSQ